jgi:hypothetical protein
LDIFINYGIGPDNAAYLSLSKHGKGADPIADAQREANREGDEELAKKLAPRLRILEWVIDRQDEDEGPQLFNCPFTVDKAFVNLARDEDTGEVLFIDDPDKGCDIRFYKEGKGLNTDYDASRMKLMEPGPLSDDEEQAEKWLEYIQENPVPNTLNFFSADYISAIFNGAPSKGRTVDEDESPRPKVKPALKQDDDDETPVTRKVRPRPKTVEPEDEPEDEAPKKDESIRERITRRRKEAEAEAEDDDE